eukprot:g63074.t1
MFLKFQNDSKTYSFETGDFKTPVSVLILSFGFETGDFKTPQFRVSKLNFGSLGDFAWIYRDLAIMEQNLEPCF